MWIQIIDEQAMEYARSKIYESRKRLWDEFIQQETDKMNRDIRRAEELSKPKELAVIAQDAIEWNVSPVIDKCAEDGG